LEPTYVDKLHTPGSVRKDEILFTELENDENNVVNDVLIEEKFGLIYVENEESPGPQNISG
jgi:hypothetical protein